MDQRRQDIFQAERRANDILNITKNHFLSEISSISLIREKAYFPIITKWVKISGYRALSDKNTTRDMVNRAVTNWISSKRNFEDEIGFAVVVNGEDSGVYYGSSRISPKENFTAVIPECIAQEITPNRIFTQFNGIVLGSVEGDNLAELILNSGLKNCYVSLFIVPYTSAEVEKRIRELERQYAELEPYKSFQRVFGSATRRVEEITNDVVKSALDSLRENIEFLRSYKGIGLVRTVVKYGANSGSEYEQLTGIIHSAMRTTQDSYCEPIRSFKLNEVGYNWDEHLSVPYASFVESGNGVHLLSMQSIDRIATLCMLPESSTKYCFIKNYNIDENSMNLYGMERSVSGEISLGRSMISGNKIGIPVNELICHTGIFGGTGAGKTTTMKKLLFELNRKNIPFVVIEAAKKEYVELISEVDNLSVYTPGTNGALLLINPLEPENGTLIENQVDMLVRAIVAAHGNEHPIPESFEGLLKYSYEKRGWKYGDIAYKDARKPFPTFKEVYFNINEYIEKHAKYGAEVKQNLTAALTLRSENMYSGALGKCFEQPSGLSGKDLLNNPTVIELADFSESATTFIMNVIMYKLQCYLGLQPKSDVLKHLIVVEEAHNVFRRSKVEGSGRDINNQYFDKMFSEIRASGTGIIISDQRPGILSDAVIANTAIKVIHVMENREDRDIVANALDLTEIQKKRIREFAAGECIISIRGIFGQDMVKVDKLASHDEINAACTVCNARFNCRRQELAARLRQYPVLRIKYYLAKLMNNPYNSSAVISTIDSMNNELGINGSINEKICILGLLLGEDSAISFEIARVIVNTYKKHLRGEA